MGATIALALVLFGEAPRSTLANPASPADVASPDATATAFAAFADCSAVSIEDATRLLGYVVLPPDTTARAGGNCFLTTQSMSQDGSVSYSLVTAARLLRLRPYFIAMARRCAGVVPSSPRAAICAQYVKLAGVSGLDAYYAARTALPDAKTVSGLGDEPNGAISAGGTLFVRMGAVIVEAAVSRDGAFELERSEALVRMLARRLPEPAPRRSPGGV